MLALMCPTLAVLAMALPAAEAAPKGVVGFFGNPTPCSGCPSASSLTGEFDAVQGVAVNSNPGSPNFGDIYVVDQNNDRIQRFSSLGQFELTWGRGVIKVNPEASIDLGDAYEICSHAADCKDGVQGSLGGEFLTLRGVAVDQTTGDVYVIERGDTSGGARVQAFTADGAFKWAQGKDVITDGTPSDPSNITTTQICTVPLDCKAAAAGSLGGEYGLGGTNSASGGGNGVAVVPTGTLTTTPPFSNAGNVVVTDRGNRRMQELTGGGGFARTFGWDVTTDGSPSDPINVSTFQICTVAADCKAGATGGAGVGQFATNTPNRVAVDSTGAIYTVESSANFRVQKFTPEVGPPALSAAIVNPNVGGSGPALPLTGTATAGPSTSAANNTPQDVAIGPGDHVFVLKAFPVGIGTPTALVAERRVVELDSADVYEETHATRSGIPGAIDLAVNINNEDVYIGTASPPVGGGQGVYVLGPASAPTVSLGIGVVGTHTATLHGLVDPGGPDTLIGIHTRYRFEYRKVGAPTFTVPSSDKDAGNGVGAVPVTEALDGLEADTDYEAKLVASKPFSGVASIETTLQPFSTPPAPPDVEAAYATERAMTSARLNARINPNGIVTSYRFEYGITAAYGTVVPVPDGNAGAGTASQIFSEALLGLAPGTTYHFRVTATNANGTNRSTDRTFTTRQAVDAPLGRGYELVSPADKIGGSGVGPWYAGVGSHGNSGIPAYAGERFASLSYYGASLADGGFSYGSDLTLGERTPSGWVNRPAFNRPGGFGTSEFAKIALIDAASDDLSLMAFGGGGSQLSIFPEQPAAFGPALSTTGGSALREWVSGRWEIAAPWAADQQVGNAFSVGTQVVPNGGYALAFGGLRGVAGATDPTSTPCAMSCGSNVYIDDVTAGLSDGFPGAGIRSLVNTCTGVGASRTTIPSVGSDGKMSAAECPAELPGRNGRPVSDGGASLAAQGSASGQVSNDGSRVFFMSPSHLGTGSQVACTSTGAVNTKCPPQVYVRQHNGDGSVTTRWISRSMITGQDASLMAAAVFEGATPDGDKAFFRTASPLTADDPNGGVQVPGGIRTGSPYPNSVDLYMYDFPDAVGADPGDGTLTRVSSGPTGGSDANASIGTVDSTTSALRTFGDDGTRVYFVTAAPLAGVAAPADGTISTPGGTQGQGTTRNLYLYDVSRPIDQRWRFIARLPVNTVFGVCAAGGSLSSKDTLFAGDNGTGLNGGVQTTASASCVRTTADGSFVTFFTDGQLTADDPDTTSGDIYSYDAVTDELVRLSAPQGGASGTSYECVTEGASVGARCYGDPRVSGLGTYRRRPLNVITDPADPSVRTVFFESASRLVPEDQNDVYDVYQWRDGRLSLISTGVAGAEPALYQGNDRTGRNVYFSTRDRLTWQDHDAVLDVYTARVDGGILPPPAPDFCALLADNCQGGGAPVAEAPGSQTSSAPDGGNADAEARRRLAVAGLSVKARRAASRSGILKIAVLGSGGTGKVTAVAKARIGKRSRVIARKSAQAQAGATTLELKINRAARQRLHNGKALKVALQVSAPGARGRAMTVRLPGAKP